MLRVCAAILILATGWSYLACNDNTSLRGGLGPGPVTARTESLPQQIDILPFTKPKSFNSDPIPDGIEVSLRALDAMGDAVKAWGAFRFELYRFRDASGDPRGEKIHGWEQRLDTIRDQRGFWDRVTQTYRFQLEWGGAPLTPNQKYVLEAFFEPAAGGDRVIAQPFVFEFVPDIDTIRATAGAAARM